MFIIGMIVGAFLSYNVTMTPIHSDCVKGDKAACKVEDKVSIYK